METEIKKPIGLMPMRLHREFRLWDIYAAIQRYIDAKIDIPPEWIIEMNTIERWLNKDTSPGSQLECSIKVGMTVEYITAEKDRVINTVQAVNLTEGTVMLGMEIIPIREFFENIENGKYRVIGSYV